MRVMKRATIQDCWLALALLNPGCRELTAALFFGMCF
jgi:hypothetical protein